jgi:acetyl-CoA carboxylase biotin carboxyl carrier protein
VKREVRAPIAGSVWSHVASVGQRVEAGEVLLIGECMKTEIPVEAPVAGTVTWLKACGETIEADDVVATIDVT